MVRGRSTSRSTSRRVRPRVRSPSRSRSHVSATSTNTSMPNLMTSGSRSRSRSRSRSTVRHSGVPHGLVHQDGTGTSKSFFKKVHKASKLAKNFKFESNIMQLDTINPYILDTGTAGVQIAGTIGGVVYNSPDIVALQDQLAKVYPGVGSGYTSGGVIPNYQTGQRTFKLFLDEWSSTLAFTNQSVSNITVDIYDCLAKRDGANTPELNWTSGVLQESGANVYNDPSKIPYCVPYSSKEFNNYWRVLKHTHVDLGQGRSHEHFAKIKLNKLFDMELCYTGTTFKNLTFATMLVVKGLPVCSTLAGVSGPATTSEAKLAITYAKSYKSRIVSTMPQNYKTVDNVSSYAGLNTTLVSEGSGLVQNYTEA
nr:MAG: capsid protein [Cressdnaviricota sp.]